MTLCFNCGLYSCDSPSPCLIVLISTFIGLFGLQFILLKELVLCLHFVVADLCWWNFKGYVICYGKLVWDFCCITDKSYHVPQPLGY